MAEKSIAKNSIFNVLYRLMNMVFPLVTSVYISHILMAEGVGKVGYAQNIVQYFVLLAPLGIVNYGTREIAKIRADRPASNQLFSELFLINLVSTLVCSAVYYGMILYTGWFEDKPLYLISGLMIVLNIINVEWYYQGQEEYVYIAIRSVAVKVISLIAMVLFVRTSQDYLSYALIYVLGFAGNYVFNVVNLWRKGVRLAFKGLSIVRHLKPILILLSSNIAIELYVLLGTTVLGALCNEVDVGYYTNATKLVKIVTGLITAIGSVLLPRLSYYKNQGRLEECSDLVNKIVLIMLFLAIPCGIGIALLADEMVLLLFGASFQPAAETVRIVSLLVYVFSFSNLFGTQVLLTFNQERKLLLATIAGAASNIVLNFALIPVYQHNGAAVATVVSETIVTLLTMVMSCRYIKLSVPAAFWVKTLLAGGVMGIAVYFINVAISSTILSLALSVLAGAAIFFALAFVLRNPLLAQLKQLLKK